MSQPWPDAGVGAGGPRTLRAHWRQRACRNAALEMLAECAVINGAAVFGAVRFVIHHNPRKIMQARQSYGVNVCPCGSWETPTHVHNCTHTRAHTCTHGGLPSHPAPGHRDSGKQLYSSGEPGRPSAGQWEASPDSWKAKTLQLAAPRAPACHPLLTEAAPCRRSASQGTRSSLPSGSLGHGVPPGARRLLPSGAGARGGDL